MIPTLPITLLFVTASSIVMIRIIFIIRANAPIAIKTDITIIPIGGADSGDGILTAATMPPARQIKKNKICGNAARGFFFTLQIITSSLRKLFSAYLLIFLLSFCKIKKFISYSFKLYKYFTYLSSIFKKYFAYNSAMKKFSERVKALRQEKGLSQGALAEKIKSSQKIIDYWETGTTEPKANFIIALADFFGCTTDYILGREDDMGNVNINSDLTETEKFILETFRKSSADDKAVVYGFLKYLAQKNQ